MNSTRGTQQGNIKNNISKVCLHVGKERTGHIEAIGETMLAKAGRDYRHWGHHLLPSFIYVLSTKYTILVMEVSTSLTKVLFDQNVWNLFKYLAIAVSLIAPAYKSLVPPTRIEGLIQNTHTKSVNMRFIQMHLQLTAWLAPYPYLYPNAP